MDEVRDKLSQAVDGMQMALNLILDFSNIPKDDNHERKFLVRLHESTPIKDKSLPRKYGISVVYILDGIPYDVVVPRMSELSKSTVDKYIEILGGFVFDLSDGYSGTPINEFDKDFEKLVTEGRIKRNKEPRLNDGHQGRFTWGE